MDTSSYWLNSAALPRFERIKNNCQVDVVVIGAGITGTTAAYLFKKAGCTVALLDRGRCGGFDSANTTAHLTCVTDTCLNELVKKFGKPVAKSAWEAGRAAIDQIFSNIQAENIACEFTWVPGYLHSPIDKSSKDDYSSLRRDTHLANELGFPAELIESIPFFQRAGVKFLHQAKFHPLKYLSKLLKTIPDGGSYVFENSEAEEISDASVVKIGKNQIKSTYVVLATHTPLMGKSNLVSATLFQSKLFLYTSYVLGAKIPAGVIPEASYWDISDPYYYLRIDSRRGHDYAIFGGEDHKTGQVRNTGEPYSRLESKLKEFMPEAEIDARWSGQVIETPDGLPYIGESAPKQFVATGFAGNGMTYGTLGGMMAVDAFLNRKNPWAQLFDIHRKNFWEALGITCGKIKIIPITLCVTGWARRRPNP